MISKFGIRSSSRTHLNIRTLSGSPNTTRRSRICNQLYARRPATAATDKARHALATTFVEPELLLELELLAEAVVDAVLAGFAVATP
jgi:hypothetical protein